MLLLKPQTVLSNYTNPHHLGFSVLLYDVIIDGFLNVYARILDDVGRVTVGFGRFFTNGRILHNVNHNIDKISYGN